MNGNLIPEWGLTTSAVLPEGLYIGHGAVVEVFWDKGEERMFLYIDRAYIIHFMIPNNAPRSNAGICKL
ncbi:hypothetical protein [Bacillus sp. ISL-57]|uniref:hypothetical protein n=1 Tax=Bacillus sp. ISL-57 TaxID=2819135 RepID=UPI001BE830E4|nr:hypothetical protein [Bacillus sp. ISL-57]MBT2719121.1 hypothetical protein [Bacillus sp. ISL-57]